MRGAGFWGRAGQTGTAATSLCCLIGLRRISVCLLYLCLYLCLYICQGHTQPLLPHCSTLMIVNTGLVHTCTSSSRICISTCICVFAWKCVQMACCAAQLLGSAGKHLAAQAGAPSIKLPVLISLYLCASFCICICICAPSIKLSCTDLFVSVCFLFCPIGFVSL